MTEGRTNLASAITNHMQKKKKKKRARVELGRLRQDPFLCGYNLSSRYYYFETRLKIKTLLRFVTLYWEIRSSAMSSFGCLRQIVVIYVDSAKIAIPMLPLEGRTKWRNNSLGFWQILSLYLRTYVCMYDSGRPCGHAHGTGSRLSQGERSRGTYFPNPTD